MSAADGYVVGLTKIHDSGSPADRWNLVIVAEGYTAADLSTFESDAQELAETLFDTPPFDEEEVACAINIYRLDVVSNEAGADDPDCDGAGAGTTADTYFDATYCADGVIRRLLSGDGGLVQDTVDDHLPEWDEIVVLVNAPVRGGAGGSVAWLANSSWDWKDVFLHELGHAAFDLADEYDYWDPGDLDPDNDDYDGAEPGAVNVTAESDPAAVKWSALVTAGVDIPTMSNADCSTTNSDPSPVAAGTVGTFEGAMYHRCGIYRPQYRCRMRSSTVDFCAVCQQQIRNVLGAYAAPAADGDVTPDSLSINFVDIPEGTSTVRAAVFTIDSCMPTTLEVTSAPSAPFDVQGASAIVSSPEGGPVRQARIWFRYDTTNVGDADMDTADIRCVDTGETWTFTLTGNTVERPKAAVQLVLDRSGSMLDVTSEGRTKEQLLRDSAAVVIEIGYDETGIGLNSFDHDAQPILDVTELGNVLGPGRITVRNALNGYSANPLGLTAIGDGIELARQKLDATAGYDVKAMIVLTDGIETAEKYIADVADTVIDEYVYAIGMGTAEQIQPASLNALTNGTGGYMLMTGNLTTDDTYRLAKYYLQILAGITNNDIILDPEGTLDPMEASVRIPFDVNESDIEITAVVLSTMPQALRVALETPDGDIINMAVAQGNPQITAAYGSSTIHFRTSLPLLHDGKAAGAGRWHLLLQTDYKQYLNLMRETNRSNEFVYVEPGYKPVSYSANVLTYSNLRLNTNIAQNSLEPGAQVTIQCSISEYGGPFGGSAHIFCELEDPTGATSVLNLADMGDETWRASFPAHHSGNYYLRIRANGSTTRGQNFTREQLRSVAVWNGGDTPGGGGGGGSKDDCCNDLRELICCLVKSGALTDQYLKDMEKRGIDPKRFMSCMKRFCSRKPR